MLTEFMMVVYIIIIETKASKETRMDKKETKRKLRDDLTEEQKIEALRIGSVEFKSTGATRKK